MSSAIHDRLIAVLPDRVRTTLSGLGFADISSQRLEDLGISSLETVEIVEALEESIGVEFEVDELLELTELTLGELADRVERKTQSSAQPAEPPLVESDG